jgi:serine/threonine-protein kinase
MAKRCQTCDIAYDDSQAFCARCGTALRAESHGDLVGTVIGERYLVTGVIGEGGMGRVYRARHVRLPKDVAIKVLDARVARDPGALRRFADEATRQSRVRNPHVVAVEDFGETADREPYLVMELVEGPTLRDVLAQGAMSPARVVRCITQLADGLEAIHALPIVHRDLKPENVMLTSGADGHELAKLLDFGIGKALDDSDRGRTQTGLVIGTPAYMSPEQVAGEPLDPRSDIYALALMAYEMLAGRLPFAGNSPHELMYSRLASDPSPVTVERQRSGREALASSVDVVLSRALARNRDDRTPTATEFARSLAAALTTPTAMEALASRSGRTVETMTPVLSMPAVPEPSARSTEPSAPSSPSAGARRPLAIAIGGVALAALGWVGWQRMQDSSASSAKVVADSARATAAPAPPPAAPPAQQNETRPPVPVPTPTPTPGTPSPTVERSAPADLAELEAIGRMIDSGDDSVSPQILDRSSALLARLRTADDSAEALLYRGNAFLLQGNTIEACRTFERARPTTARTGTISSLKMMRATAGCP